MKEFIKHRSEELHHDLVKVRRHLHQNPELSYEEFKTSEFIQQRLSELGIPFEIVSGTGVVGLIKGAEPRTCVALRGDMDALPIKEANDVDYASKNIGVMHACGHDVHTTCLLGAAQILNEKKHELKGSIKLIFQLGEEMLPGGASMMIKEGVLKSPSPASIFGQHVFPEMEVGKVGFRSGPYMASADEIHLKVIGRGGHAALPDKNIDTVLIAANIISGIQQVVSRRANPKMPTVLSFGKVLAEGATNVIPDTVSIAGTFRTFNEEWRFKAHEIIKDFAEKTAEAAGGKCEVDIRVGYPFVNNHRDATALAKEAAIELLGKDNVIDLEMRMTAEDFAFYTQEVPGSFFRLGVRETAMSKERGLHTTTFDVDEKCLSIGAGLLAYIAFKSLQNEND